MTKINYSKQRLKQSLGMGIYLSIIGLIILIIALIFSIEIKGIKLEGTGVGLIAAGIFSVIVHLYEKRKQYLTIGDGLLKTNSLFPKRVILNEVKQMKKFGGDYILKTDKSEFTIDTQVIDEKSLVVLNRELEKLSLKWN